MSFFRPKPKHRVYGAVRPDSRSEAPRRLKIVRSVFSGKMVWFWLRAGLVLLVVGFLGVTALFAWASRDLPDPNHITDRLITESTKIYDRSGEHLLYEVYQNKKRTVVGMDQMSPWLPKATVAIEDKGFYQHSGVKILSIIRAGVNNFIGRRSGGGGASTITQQLIKNVVVGNERSIFRKMKEAILAIRLEKEYSKDEILKLYLNEIPYGSTNYGVEAASQSYFHKSAKDVNLSEAATLAAMIQAPSRYLNNPNSLRGRRDLVLGLMYQQGMITEAEKTAAQGEALRIYRTGGILAAPHFVLYVKQLLADRFGENQVDTGGLKVITTLDYDKQQLAEKLVKENGDKFAKSYNANNAALVAIDPKTGEVLSMVGSRDFFNEEIDGQFNVAVLGRRQPGSSLKPFVYTLGFQKGYTPETVLYDVSTNFDERLGQSYRPKDASGKELGLVTVRRALQASLNIPAVKMLYLVGPQNAIDFLKNFGYTTFTGDYGLSLVLGGAEVSLLEHTNGYATLADNGVYHSPSSILKVESDKGDTLYEWKPSVGSVAVSPELAAKITNVLTDNLSREGAFSLKNNLILPDRPVAAKTGTTNDSKDAWTLGFVPSLAAGVWVGNTTPKPMKSGGNTLAGLIWNQFMKGALASTTPEQFPSSSPSTATKPVLRGANNGIVLPINVTNGLIATSNTPFDVVEMRRYLPPHDILYYVNKDDPNGPPPLDPASDPQYDNWEKGLQEWVARQEKAGKAVTLEEPPTEYDTTVVSGDLTPTITIDFPSAGEVLSSRQINITVTALAPRGIAKVLYQIDGKDIGYVSQYPFSLNYLAKDLTKGAHTLKAIASDDQGNSAFAEVAFDLEAEPLPPNFEWVDRASIILSADDYPRLMALAPYRWEDIKEVKIYLGEKWIYTFNHAEDKLVNSQLQFMWKNSPGTGNYTLRAVMTDNFGATVEKDLAVEVR